MNNNASLRIPRPAAFDILRSSRKTQTMKTLLLLLTVASYAYPAHLILKYKLELRDPSHVKNPDGQFTNVFARAINSDGEITGTVNGTCGGKSCNVAFFWAGQGHNPPLVVSTESNYTACPFPGVIDNQQRVYCEHLMVGFARSKTSLKLRQCSPNDVAKYLNLRATALNGWGLAAVNPDIVESGKKIYARALLFKMKGDEESGCSLDESGPFAGGGDGWNVYVAGLSNGFATGWTADFPEDFDNHGQDESNLPGAAALWLDRTKPPKLLPKTPEGLRPQSGRAVNDRGWVVGQTINEAQWWSGSGAKAFVSMPTLFGGYRTELLPPVQNDDYGYGADAVNHAGIILGRFKGGSYAGLWKRVHRKWTAVDLNDHKRVMIVEFNPKLCPDLRFVEADAINDAGQITGRAQCTANAQNGPFRVFRLTPER